MDESMTEVNEVYSMYLRYCKTIEKYGGLEPSITFGAYYELKRSFKCNKDWRLMAKHRAEVYLIKRGK